jgi:Mg2+ and Co2+ transporter CorA
VVNTCIQRELNTTEWNLENEDLGLEHLHEHLTRLYKIQRRTTLYEVLIKEQRDACRQHGRKDWDRSLSPTSVSVLSKAITALEIDFAFVTDQVVKNQDRVAKKIGLLMAHISLVESRVVVANGKRVEALTLVAIFFLPFSLVASVMNLNGELRPGGSKQYVFWVVSIPFEAVLALAYMLYSRSWAQ